jgi:hypothetical protein
MTVLLHERRSAVCSAGQVTCIVLIRRVTYVTAHLHYSSHLEIPASLIIVNCFTDINIIDLRD